MGSFYCNYKALEKIYEDILYNPGVYVVINGDLIDNLFAIANGKSRNIHSSQLIESDLQFFALIKMGANLPRRATNFEINAIYIINFFIKKNL